MGYVDLDSIHRAANNTKPPHQWGDQVNDNSKFLAGSAGATVATSESTVSTLYTDLTTVGPTVTLVTGTRALVVVSAWLSNSGASWSTTGIAVSGGTTIAAVDGTGLNLNGTLEAGQSFIVPLFGLNPGSNTFTVKYKTSGGTATFRFRQIAVIPLP